MWVGDLRIDNRINQKIYPTVIQSNTPVAQAATATLTTAALDTIQTNTGASGTTVITLPSVQVSKNRVIRFAQTAAQAVQITPASGEKIFLSGSGVADKYCQIAGVIGNYADLYCDGVNWVVTNYSGVVTKQP